MWVRSLGLEALLENEMATYSSIPAWKVPWTEKPDGLQFIGHKDLDMTQRLNTDTETHRNTHTHGKFIYL